MRLNLVPVAALAALLFPSTARAATEICGNGADESTSGESGFEMTDEGCDPYSVHGVCESPLDCNAAGSVAPRTGQLVWRGEQPDITVQTALGPNLQMHRFYMSQYSPGYSSWTYKSNLGKYWHHGYMSWIVKEESPDPDTAVLHLPTGQDVWFEKTSGDSTWSYFTPQKGWDFKELKQCKLAAGCSGLPQYDWRLQMLTGEVYTYDGVDGSHTAKLAGMSNRFGQAVTLAYDGATGFLKTVTSPYGKQYRFRFAYYTSTHANADLLSHLYAESCTETGAGNCLDESDWTTEKTLLYTYESDDQLSEVAVDLATDVIIAGYTYSSDYLNQVKDSASSSTITATFDFYSPSGELARQSVGFGSVGYTWDDSTCDSGNGVVVLFHKKNTTACSGDGDCGTNGYCGGKTSSTSTGACYQAKRCVNSTTTAGEHLVDAVAGTCGAPEFVGRNSAFERDR